MLPLLLLPVVLAQPLDTSKVAVTREEKPVTEAPQEARFLPQAPDGADDAVTADFAALRERFDAIAAAEGLPGFQRPEATPREVREDRTPVPPSPHRQPEPAAVGVRREAKKGRALWTFTADAYSHRWEGAGCCPPCPCTPEGVCAPCARCEQGDDCRFVTTGTRLAVTFTVVGRRLTKQHTLVQRVSASQATGKARKPAPAPGRAGP